MSQLTVGELRKQLEGLPDSMPIVLSQDDEGNGYRKVYVGTDVGYFLDGEYTTANTMEYLKEDKDLKENHARVYQSMYEESKRIIESGESVFCIQ